MLFTLMHIWLLQQGKSPYPPKHYSANVEYDDYVDAHPEDLEFVAEIGAEAIHTAARKYGS